MNFIVFVILSAVVVGFLFLKRFKNAPQEHQRQRFQTLVGGDSGIGTVGQVGSITSARFPAEFRNFDLTIKPRGVEFESNNWWKERQCLKTCVNGNASDFADNEEPYVADQSTVPVTAKHYDSAYYLNSSHFCQRYPHHRLCPNHWVVEW